MKLTKNGRFYSVLMLALMGVVPARAQDVSLDQVLAGRQRPLSISAKQLTGEYRRMVVNGPAGIASLQNMMVGAKTGVETGLYFSKGEIVTAGGETYLLAYRPNFPIDPMIFNGHGHGRGDQEPVRPRKLRPNMMLSLSLLNLRTNARLDDISAFDAKRDMESPQESSEASERNLRALGRGMLTYFNGRGRGVMPIIGTALTPALKRTFYPFVHDQNLWIQPATEEPYRPNPRVSGVNVKSVANRKFLVAFSENTPGSDGLRGVLFLDGHVERVSAARWAQLQRTKVIPRAGVKSVYTDGRMASRNEDATVTTVTRPVDIEED